MLTQEERTEIQAEIAKAFTKKSAIVDVLKVVQRHRGWVPDLALEEAAEMLGMTPDEIDSVATFYSLIYRRPVGKNVILVCDSVCCWLVGYEGLREHLIKKLGIEMGQTTLDKRFTLLPAACLGVCDQAPAMMVNDDLYTRLTPELVDQILERY